MGRVSELKKKDRLINTLGGPANRRKKKRAKVRKNL